MLSKQPTVLITGAAKRIGAVIAKTLHLQGFNIIIHYNNSKLAAQNITAHLNNIRELSAISIKANLAKDCEVLIKLVNNSTENLQHVVNNASIFLEDATSCWDSLFNINTKAPYILSLGLFTQLKANNGTIVNITDTHSTHPLKNYSIYCQTKAALVMQTKALAREFAPFVRVNAIAPGAILWPQGIADFKKERIINATPLKKHGIPQDVAQAVLFLLENNFITGEQIKIDGGRNI